MWVSQVIIKLAVADQPCFVLCRRALEELEDGLETSELGLGIGPVDLGVAVLKGPDELVEDKTAEELDDPANAGNDAKDNTDDARHVVLADEETDGVHKTRRAGVRSTDRHVQAVDDVDTAKDKVAVWDC